MKNNIEKEINWLIKNWDKIPDKFKTLLTKNDYTGVKGLNTDEHVVVLLLDRQKPSVVADYSFNEERIGITRTAKVLWGFDSGCSCPSPWHDNYPDCYSVSKEWKQFEVNLKDFDEGVIEECLAKIAEIKKSI